MSLSTGFLPEPAKHPPAGFSRLCNVIDAAASPPATSVPVSFLGMVTRLSVPVREANGDFALEFTVQDQFDSPGSESSICCKVSRNELNKLPTIRAVGDFVLIYNFNVIAGQPPTAVSTRAEPGSRVLSFSRSTIPQPEFSQSIQGAGSKLPYVTLDAGPHPTTEQQMAIVYMKQAAASFVPPKSTRPNMPTTQKKQKLCELKDMELSKYYDLIGEVVKTFAANYETFDLYVTDYTTNNDLFLYEERDDTDDFMFGAQKKWPGPFGRMTMAIRLYEPHASFARNNVREGDFVYLQNIHSKLSQVGNLEGAIHQDRKYLDRVNIRICTHPDQIASIKERKEAYEQPAFGSTVNQNQPKKASAKAAAKKKEEKRERQRLQKELEQQELEKKAEELDAAKAGLNPHIRAGNTDKRISNITEIVHNPHLTTETEIGNLSLPFVNCKYRARVRVVDMWPRKLFDFARSLSDPKYGKQGLSADHRESYRKEVFQWNFALLVENADAPAGKTPDRLMLTVGDEQGQCLLKMDACDLRQSPEKRKRLEEKLFILWGNLRERKIALLKEGIHLPLPTGDSRLQLQNKPFDCCIEEFGEPVGKNLGNPKSWVRRHTLFNTTIMD
ncbi:hypothetical protein K458DRAFT_316677 [Lentithecium fluviatile CBS 122367]|uniref:Protection of telomeres protein 1 ssDNA-binding domain-containing protein n=1 Tax=Lentithecium fluviatile CBS 122367 TaxID=1168545 RepID=A0A6G1IKI7_9PLEO|nr:hypothetical protein K458DRAFT_316677 [Lentithecium fluviatile CBS 122367]